jgi:uncharacterized protein
MRLFPWTRSAALPLLICITTLCMTIITSCSVPDGPVPGETGSGETVPNAEPTITLSGPGQLLPVSATAEMAGEIFELEVASTQQQQALGLMFRSELPANRGMLFPFASPRRTRFWMKDVPVPLDMVFLRNGEVIAIAASAPPCEAEPCPTYGPDNQIVDQVIELRSGRAAEIGLAAGDTVTIRELTTEN